MVVAETPFDPRAVQRVAVVVRPDPNEAVGMAVAKSAAIAVTEIETGIGIGIGIEIGIGIGIGIGIERLLLTTQRRFHRSWCHASCATYDWRWRQPLPRS